eukprot:COSAG02_NODE_33709_length_496_cov_0.639798_1_plen_52_part_10
MRGTAVPYYYYYCSASHSGSDELESSLRLLACLADLTQPDIQPIHVGKSTSS